MKKLLIASAALAMVAGTAQAQSSVTVYGNVDIGYGETTTKTSNNLTGVTAKGVTTGLNEAGAGPGYSSSNAFGIRGTEDLGGGTKASFVLESALNPAGTNAGPEGANSTFGGNTRQSFLELSNTKMGELRIGYQYTMEHNALAGRGISGSQNMVGTTQNMVGTLVTAVAGASIGTGDTAAEDAALLAAAPTGAKQTRNNMIQYVSPAFGPTKVIVQFGQAENSANAGTAGALTTGQKKNDMYSLGLDINSGKFTGIVGYSNLKRDTGVAASGAAVSATNLVDTRVSAFNHNRKQDAYFFGGNYNLGPAKLFANYVQREDKVDLSSLTDANINATSVRTKGNSYDFGVQVPVGKTTLLASIGSGERKYSITGQFGEAKDKIDAMQLGAIYALSKRTSAYAMYGENKSKLATTDNAVNAQIKVNTVAAGLRHSF
jgi:predicted porin